MRVFLFILLFLPLLFTNPEKKEKRVYPHSAAEYITYKEVAPDVFVPEITLTTLKAFPGAFGAGSDATGGRGGTYVVVSNLNDSGAGSFRAAWDKGGARIVIVRVEGRVDKLTEIKPTSSTRSNMTIWGQFAPGRGITVSGGPGGTINGRLSFSNAGNFIIRHITAQNKYTDCVPNQGCSDAMNFYEIASGTSNYFDHLSLRYGSDQTILVTSKFSTIKSTMASCLLAEAWPDHNTGAIFGDNGTGGVAAGNHTVARNMWYNISHRFPNASGSPINIEVYNNYISNPYVRTMRTNGPAKVDFFKNYIDIGNKSLFQSSNCNTNAGDPEAGIVNRMAYNSGFETYTGWNYFEGVDVTPNDNQTNMWRLFKDGGGLLECQPIASGHYVSSRQHSFGDPANGIWDAVQLQDSLLIDVGHNRGINADGSPGFFQDDKDADYINRTLTGTTESDYRNVTAWDNSSFPGTSMYADVDGDYIPDWFVNQDFDQPTGGESALNNTNTTDREQVIVNWDFGSYTVVNNAGYTNLEIAAAYYANDFANMLGSGSGGTVAVTGVDVTPNSDTNFTGQTQQFTATVSPANATDKSGVWSSSNEAVATVDSGGLVTYVGAGTSNINFVTTDGSFGDPSAVTISTPAGGGATPVISLIGPNPYNMSEDQFYFEHGASWTDAEDGSGTNVTIGGDNIVELPVGSYTVTYNFTDTDSNAATQVTRTVNVLPVPYPTGGKVGVGISKGYTINGVFHTYKENKQ